MMLKSIEIENFKAFGLRQRIELKPITLIFGANSAGKSSIIHSLLWAHEAITRGNLDVHKPRIAGTSVDLGGFRQFVHKRNVESHVGFTMELDCARLHGRLAELLAPVSSVSIQLTVGCERPEEPPTADQDTLFDIEPPKELQQGPRVRLETYSLVGDGQEILSMSSRRDGTLRIDQLDHDHKVFREIYRALEETVAAPNLQEGLSPETIKRVIDEEILGSLTARGPNLLPFRILDSKQSPSIRERLMSAAKEEAGSEWITRTIRMFFVPTLHDLIHLISQTVRAEFHRLSYLGPLRTFPPRHLSYVDNDDPNWQSGGGSAWEVVRDDPTIRNRVNGWLSSEERLQTPYRLTVREMAAIDQIEDHLYRGLEELSERGLEIEQEFDDEGKASGAYPVILDLEKEAGRLRRKIEIAQIDKARELSLVDIRKNTVVSHRDVGIGISQVLPVLVQAYATSYRILAMEQPEIHLHPKLQAELGDVFIESALGPQQNRLLLETHSEHLILRILRRIRESNARQIAESYAIRPTDVCLLYVGDGKEGSVVQELRIGIEEIEVWYAQRCVERLPRLRGEGKHRIDYRHIIDWLVRKPGAFENYRYKSDLFPTSRFRMAYDWLKEHGGSKADKRYLDILYLAAREGESLVDNALRFLIETGEDLKAERVSEIVASGREIPPPTQIEIDDVELGDYDDLFSSWTAENETEFVFEGVTA